MSDPILVEPSVNAPAISHGGDCYYQSGPTLAPSAVAAGQVTQHGGCPDCPPPGGDSGPCTDCADCPSSITITISGFTRNPAVNTTYVFTKHASGGGCSYSYQPALDNPDDYMD